MGPSGAPGTRCHHVMGAPGLDVWLTPGGRLPSLSLLPIEGTANAEVSNRGQRAGVAPVTPAGPAPGPDPAPPPWALAAAPHLTQVWLPQSVLGTPSVDGAGPALSSPAREGQGPVSNPPWALPSLSSRRVDSSCSPGPTGQAVLGVTHMQPRPPRAPTAESSKESPARGRGQSLRHTPGSSRAALPLPFRGTPGGRDPRRSQARPPPHLSENQDSANCPLHRAGQAQRGPPA